MSSGVDTSRRPAPARAAHRGPRRRRWPRRLLAGVLAAAVLLGAAGTALWAATPSVSDAPGRVAAILAAHHDPSDGGQVATKVGDALLATEDSRYYSDPALDPLGVLRAGWGALSGNSAAGGATIEQQLAKLLYTPGRSDPGAEVEQVVLAFKLDSRFTKTRILAMYLDAAYFGDGAYGITAAARRYFAKTPSELSWAQASLLAGLVQAPSAYDPVHHLSVARLRQAHVLTRLVATGHLSSAEARRVAAEPLDPAVPFGG